MMLVAIPGRLLDHPEVAAVEEGPAWAALL